MRKLFILSLLAMMIAIGGCGSGGTSADPLGTDSIMFADAAGSVAPQVNPNGAVSLKATVKNAFGTAVVGREVSFTIVSNASGATLASSTANTDGAGEATILYTAGTTAGSDVVRASISNGATMDVNITVGGGGGVSTYAVSIAAFTGTGTTPVTVTAGQVSIITATVTSTSGSTSTPAGGVTVSFTLPVNSSGATLSAATATTDSSGKAVVIYQPGTTSPTLTMQDTVQAAVGTATSAVAIERTGSTTSAFIITVGATPPTVSILGGSSVITATVKNNAGTAVSGATVDFTQTGGVGVLPASATTDGSGNAVAVFTGGAGGAGTTAGVVTASITIGVNTYTDALVINHP